MEQKQERTLAMACHLLGLVTFIGPLIIWLIKKDESALVDQNGKEALNFQISIFIYSVVAAMLTAVVIGFLLLPAIWLFNVIMIIVATVKTNSGEDFRYPLCIRLIK